MMRALTAELMGLDVEPYCTNYDGTVVTTSGEHRLAAWQVGRRQGQVFARTHVGGGLARAADSRLSSAAERQGCNSLDSGIARSDQSQA
jgi:hypothetical protein